MKTKIQYTCLNCGFISNKWLGKCPECQSWGSLTEEVLSEENFQKKLAPFKTTSSKPKQLKDIYSDKISRWKTGQEEFDLLLGDGIMPGSLILIGGEPGIGKSTLMLQISQALSEKNKKILYISGEESEEQIKHRAERLQINSENIFIYNETSIEAIYNQLENIKPDLIIVDSIQTTYRSDIDAAAGTVSQIKGVANSFLNIAKSNNIAIFLIGHITKEGIIAGPKLLEHTVDTVLYFEGDKFQRYRILRCVKNRYGSVNELCLYEMTSKGLKVVKNPSQFFISGRLKNSAGSTILPSIEGSKAFLLEIQALVSQSYFGNSRRMANGIDINRLHMLLAVLEKKLEYPLGSQDVYVNVIGGISITDPAADLPIAIAIISSFINKPINEDIILFGEIGLIGEIRAVQYADSRIKEAYNLGFSKCILPAINKSNLNIKLPISLIGINKLQDAINYLWHHS